MITDSACFLDKYVSLDSQYLKNSKLKINLYLVSIIK